MAHGSWIAIQMVVPSTPWNFTDTPGRELENSTSPEYDETVVFTRYTGGSMPAYPSQIIKDGCTGYVEVP